MVTTPKKKHTGNMGLFLIGSGIYLGLVFLFAWQTWSFVDWLFPGDQLMMKLLTVLCFDVMAVFWALVDLFYRFATKGARNLVRWAWGISFTLSLITTIFYMVIQSMFRFQVQLTQQTVDVGYGIVIFALTLNILFLTFWIYQEWLARHPHNDEYEGATVHDDTPRYPGPVGGRPIEGQVTVNELIERLSQKLAAVQIPQQSQPLNLPDPESFVQDLIDLVRTSPKEQAPSPNGAKLNGK